MFLLKLLSSFSCVCIVLSQTTADVSDSSSVSASDCLSYIYVAWIFFIYAVGSGVQQSQFYQVSVCGAEFQIELTPYWGGEYLMTTTQNFSTM